MDIKTICLAILAEGNATGYEIQKTIKDGPLASFFDASFGSIYPALARLSEEDLTNALLFASRQRPEVVYFVSGHDEKQLDGATLGAAVVIRSAAGNFGQ